MPTTPESWTVIASCESELETLLAKGALEGADIPCRTKLHQKGKEATTDILVQPAHAAKAKEVLASGGGSLF